MTPQLAKRCITAAMICTSGLLSAAFALPVSAQATSAEPAAPPADSNKPPARGHEWFERWQSSSVDRAYKLKYPASAQDANELLTGLRNMLEPMTKIFLVPSTQIIVVHAPEEEQARVQNLLTKLDQPHPRYRLTYMLTEMDGTRKVGVQHFSMVVLSGQRSQAKQGSRLPISTGGGQFTYIDVGMNFDVTLQAIDGGAVIREKVEQSSIAPDTTTAMGSNPLLRQTALEGTTSLTLGKPQVVGSLDVPASTRHFDVQVEIEPVS